MKKLLTVVTLFISFMVNGQNNNTENKLVGGKWSVCTSLTFSKDYQCTKGYTRYEFFSDGIYKEDRQPTYMGKTLPFVSGVWTLNADKLVITETADQYHKSAPHNYTITWLDKDRFYASGKEGPKTTVYIFFQRS